MARLTSEFWVSAYLRTRNADGVVAVVRRRGAAEAGAVFVRIDRMDRTCDLYGPAPQSAWDDTAATGRLFARIGPAAMPDPEAEERLAREQRFDPDLWLVEVEDRDGRHGLELAQG